VKKSILIIATMAFIGLMGSQAFACYWDGYWGGPMGGPVAGAHSPAYQGFYDQTQQLRQDLAAKRGEYNALMAKSNPDPKRAAELSRQIASLDDQLRAKAQSLNMPALGSGYGYGTPGGYGRMGGGYWCNW
jgi:zinc resistance-associated protein